MTIYDILGPIMVGPSSSHTAGAVRIGLAARKLLGEKPVSAEITLSGSFLATGKGHGTDRALVAGLLGMMPDDERISHSFSIAREQGLEFQFFAKEIKGAHPNTAFLSVQSVHQGKLDVMASSLGGGRIMINQLNGVSINVTGEKPVLIIRNQDSPGHVATVTSMIAVQSINIATMNLYREKRGGYATMVIETDQNIPVELIHKLKSSAGIVHVTYLNIGEN